MKKKKKGIIEFDCLLEHEIRKNIYESFIEVVAAFVSIYIFILFRLRNYNSNAV